MDKMPKKMVHELDEIILRAPDVDVEHEYTQFCEAHEASLWDEKMVSPEILQRIMLVNDLIRFQYHFIMGSDVSLILHKILNCAQHMKKDELVKNFSCTKRMAQMAKILEQKNIAVLCEQAKKRRVS